MVCVCCVVLCCVAARCYGYSASLSWWRWLQRSSPFHTHCTVWGSLFIAPLLLLRGAAYITKETVTGCKIYEVLNEVVIYFTTKANSSLFYSFLGLPTREHVVSEYEGSVI